MSLPNELRGACIRLRAIGVDDVQEDIDWLCDLLSRAAEERDRLAADLDRTTDALKPFLVFAGFALEDSDDGVQWAPECERALVSTYFTPDQFDALLASVHPEES